MTVRINFLPKSYQPSRRFGFKELALGMAAVAAAAAVAVGYMNTYTGILRLEKQAEADAAQLQGVKAQMAQAADIKAREERVERVEADLKALVGRPWSSVLLTLRDLTPQQVTWTSLSVQGDVITLRAITRGLTDLAQLMGGLIVHGEVEQLVLRYMNEKGLPVTLVAKAGDKESQAKLEKLTLNYRQMEFELIITLTKAERGKNPHGA